MGKQGMKQSTFVARDFSIESMNFSLEQTGDGEEIFQGMDQRNAKCLQEQVHWIRLSSHVVYDVGLYLCYFLVSV